MGQQQQTAPSAAAPEAARDSQGESEEEEAGVAPGGGGRPEERRRRLLYVDLGRPRPFYRVTAEDADEADGGQAPVGAAGGGGDVPSLQVGNNVKLQTGGDHFARILWILLTSCRVGQAAVNSKSKSTYVSLITV